MYSYFRSQALNLRSCNCCFIIATIHFQDYDDCCCEQLHWVIFYFTVLIETNFYFFVEGTSIFIIIDLLIKIIIVKIAEYFKNTKFIFLFAVRALNYLKILWLVIEHRRELKLNRSIPNYLFWIIAVKYMCRWPWVWFIHWDYRFPYLKYI